MYKLSTFLFALFFFSSLGLAQSNIFFDNFDSYTAGVGVACSNPTVWTTWSNAPCGSEDALVSNTYSYSASNSAKVIYNNDLVKDFGTAYTAGKYKISFQVYIPATKAGYFNTLATFAGGTSSWGMECYFDAGGTGRINGGSATAVPFTWPVATWFLVEHVVDLDADQSTMTINGTLVHTWQWTLGANGAGCPLTLDANDFFGATASDEMYFDNYSIDDMSVPPPIFLENFDTYIAGQQVACQNPAFWTTWSLSPCNATEDPMVSSTYSASAPNSAKIVLNNDLVKDFGPAYTSGKYKISFKVYIPATKAGYFNTLATFAGGTSNWAIEVYFDAGGAGRVNPNGSVPATFTWTAGQWNLVEHVVDLTNDLGELYFNGALIHTQQYTIGAYTTVVPLTLDANDFFGATANDEMYFDDYALENLTVVPVELSAFSANVNNGNVVLNWTTETELNNQGFEIERRTAESQFVAIGHVQGNGTTTERKEYSFTDASVEAGQYFYRLKQVDYNGMYEYSNEVFAEIIALPAEFVLDQNYPNPFNPTTSINFSLAEPTFVKLAVYNLLGEVVQVLKNENMIAGSYNVTFDAASLPSGMYLYKIETAQYTSVRKMMLMK